VRGPSWLVLSRRVCPATAHSSLGAGVVASSSWLASSAWPNLVGSRASRAEGLLSCRRGCGSLDLEIESAEFEFLKLGVRFKALGSFGDGAVGPGNCAAAHRQYFHGRKDFRAPPRQKVSFICWPRVALRRRPAPPSLLVFRSPHPPWKTAATPLSHAGTSLFQSLLFLTEGAAEQSQRWVPVSSYPILPSSHPLSLHPPQRIARHSVHGDPMEADDPQAKRKRRALRARARSPATPRSRARTSTARPRRSRP